MELKEITSFGKLKVIHEAITKDGETMTIKARIADTKRNANNRSYPASLLKREVERVQKQIESGGLFGTAEHPVSGNQMVTGASHIVKKMWYEPVTKEVWAEMKIIPTTRGKDVMTLIKNGAQLGLSTRGTGSVSSEGRVMDDYKLKGVDIVGSPSSQGATFDKDAIFESVGFEAKPEEEMKHKAELINAHHQKAKKAIDEAGTKKEGENKMKRTPLQEEIRTNLIVNYHTAKKEKGFQGTIEEWKATDKNEQRVTAAVEFADGKYETLQEALLANDAPVQDIIEVSEIDPHKYASEAILAGISPIEYAKRINAHIGKSVKIAAFKNSITHDQFIVAEAIAAGKDVSTPEKMLEVLERSEQVVIAETDEDLILEAQAVKIHKQLNESGEEVSLDTVRRGLIKEREAKEKAELKQKKISFLVNETMLAGGIIRRKEEK